MTGRLESTFSALKKESRAALITYIMAGDPSLDQTLNLMRELPKAGADIIEVGIPFSDPMADGPIIQAAAIRSLKAGTTLAAVLHTIATIRKENDTTPLVLMGYYNPIYHYGVEKFCKEAVSAGVDGIIIVDLPPEEEEEFTCFSKTAGLHLIRLIAPSTDDARLTVLTHQASGFLYYISIAGITGTKSANIAALRERVGHLRKQVTLPLAVGFGIKTPEQAAQVGSFSDAVVVGSALVEKLEKGSLEDALLYIQALRNAISQR